MDVLKISIDVINFGKSFFDVYCLMDVYFGILNGKVYLYNFFRRKWLVEIVFLDFVVELVNRLYVD